MTSLEARVSRLEGGYEHLATKADLTEVKVLIANLEVKQAQLEARMLRWYVGGLGTVGSAVVAGIIIDLISR